MQETCFAQDIEVCWHSLLLNASVIVQTVLSSESAPLRNRTPLEYAISLHAGFGAATVTFLTLWHIQYLAQQRLIISDAPNMM